MKRTMSYIVADQHRLSVERDEQRVHELGFGNPDKNFRNYKFFTCDIRFGIAQPVLEEAAFQLLGYERFSITGMGDKTVMSNPWDDLFNTLKWAIDNKGLNPDYLRRVSKYDFSVPENEKGERPQHTSDDEWEHYVKQVNSNERRIVVNHILVQNDGDDAVRFVNAVKERRQQLHEQGLPIGPEATRGIIRELLAEHPLLAMPKTRDAERNRVPESSELLGKQKSNNKLTKIVKMNDSQKENPRRSFHR